MTLPVGRAFVRDQAKMNRIGERGRDDGYCLRHVPESDDSVQAGSNEDIWLQLNQLFRKRR